MSDTLGNSGQTPWFTGTLRCTSLLHEVVDGECVGACRYTSARAAGIYFQACSFNHLGIVRQVQFLSQSVAALRAVAGMVPPGQTDLNPGLNAIQTLIATKHDASWQVALYQNTPAAFHGRPEAVKALTNELRQQMA